MLLSPNEIKIYKESTGRVICYPAFTSTSIDIKAFIPSKSVPGLELVLLNIKQNNTKSLISISEISVFKNEKEYYK